MNKPEIGSKWRCVVDVPNCRVGQEVEIEKHDKDDDDDPAPLVFTDRGGFFLKRFSNGEFVRVGPLPPAPAEPAKAAASEAKYSALREWERKQVARASAWKPGDRFTLSGTVLEVRPGTNFPYGVTIDGHSGDRLPEGCMHPESAHGNTVPAPAPPPGAEILSESRQHRMRIADLEGDLAEEKAAKAALAVRVAALTGDVALARRERDGWRAKWLRRDGR